MKPVQADKLANLNQMFVELARVDHPYPYSVVVLGDQALFKFLAGKEKGNYFFIVGGAGMCRWSTLVTCANVNHWGEKDARLAIDGAMKNLVEYEKQQAAQS